MTTINYFSIREKLKAKLKLDPGPELSPTVETDDQLWGHLKKWDLLSDKYPLSLTTNWQFQNEPSSVLRPEGARVDVVQGPEGGLHVPAVRLPPAGSRPRSPDPRGQSRGITRLVDRAIILQRRGVVNSNNHLPPSAICVFLLQTKMKCRQLLSVWVRGNKTCFLHDQTLVVVPPISRPEILLFKYTHSMFH